MMLWLSLLTKFASLPCLTLWFDKDFTYKSILFFPFLPPYAFLPLISFQLYYTKSLVSLLCLFILTLPLLSFSLSDSLFVSPSASLSTLFTLPFLCLFSPCLSLLSPLFLCYSAVFLRLSLPPLSASQPLSLPASLPPFREFVRQ